MPRPGPRPYECVRRAWHSDRHQPIRGSLIQEIFRVVNEIHSSSTKKNKEWQEKLPVVVLKAEEIMYSKANSEAEYMDLKTLWDRTNDAINTIIRRDENTETGELLQPCIEAALNLGCTPRRASRSQRNSNPRRYLGLSTQVPTRVPSSIVENTTQGDRTPNSQCVANYSTFMRHTTLSLTHLRSDSLIPLGQIKSWPSNKFPFVSENVPPCANQCMPMENPVSNLHSVYPLYYGKCLQLEEPQHDVGNFTKSILDSTAKNDAAQNTAYIVDASEKITRTDIRDIPENQGEIDCDLSLRLGPLSVPCPGVEISWPQEIEDFRSNCSQEGSKFSDLSPQMDKELLFFPNKYNSDGPFDSSSDKQSFKSGLMTIDPTMRKRKGVFVYPLEDHQFCWQPKVRYNPLTERMKSAGL